MYIASKIFNKIELFFIIYATDKRTAFYGKRGQAGEAYSKLRKKARQIFQGRQKNRVCDGEQEQEVLAASR